MRYTTQGGGREEGVKKEVLRNPSCPHAGHLTNGRDEDQSSPTNKPLINPPELESILKCVSRMRVKFNVSLGYSPLFDA